MPPTQRRWAVVPTLDREQLESLRAEPVGAPGEPGVAPGRPGPSRD